MFAFCARLSDMKYVSPAFYFYFFGFLKPLAEEGTVSH